MIMRLRGTLKERGRSSSSHYRDIQDGLFTKPVSIFGIELKRYFVVITEERKNKAKDAEEYSV